MWCNGRNCGSAPLRKCSCCKWCSGSTAQCLQSQRTSPLVLQLSGFSMSGFGSGSPTFWLFWLKEGVGGHWSLCLFSHPSPLTLFLSYQFQVFLTRFALHLCHLGLTASLAGLRKNIYSWIFPLEGCIMQIRSNWYTLSAASLAPSCVVSCSAAVHQDTCWRPPSLIS